MSAVKIKTTRPVTPKIYAYTTPEIARHNGWTKIGYTEQKDVEKRIRQQTHTADVKYNLEWYRPALYNNGEWFTDKAFHPYLRKSGIEQETDVDNEWFHVTPVESKNLFDKFIENYGILDTLDVVIPYTLREEQQEAVEKTLAFQKSHEFGEFLWNAKPRFGKTLATYDFCKRSGAKNILIVTNRPAIANSWFSDYARFLGSESGYLFVSEVDALKEKAGVLTRHQFSIKQSQDDSCKCIEFVSLQDLKGSVYFGGKFDKLSEVANMEWDLLIVDEAHEGVDTSKTDFAFDRIKRKFTLHLSGTPFKALANTKFADDAIYNWTYADEQRRKEEYVSLPSVEDSPYAVLPKLNLFTYQMSEIVRDEADRGIVLDGKTEEYAFDLNEFFSVIEKGKVKAFKYASSVEKFLDALVKQEKFPFSTEKLRDELKHTLWLLNRVDSAELLAKTLRDHPVFKDYEIVLAAGDGKIDDDDEIQKSYDKVVEAIKKHDKTITLSVGQLTTGVTIPEWTAVLMLSNVRSPSLYMQAAFRAQNPCLFKEGANCKRKENAYVFDFDPARTLVIFEEFANDLSSNTAAGRGDIETRKENVRKLLNFFPVIGEDENGVMVELDAAKVLEIPRKIRSVEVVKRGFMSNFLFQNIGNIFSAPKEVIDIINTFTAVAEPKEIVPSETRLDGFLDDTGQPAIPNEYVIGTASDIFGEKIYDTREEVNTLFAESEEAEYKSESMTSKLQAVVKECIIKDIIDTAKTAYSEDEKVTQIKKIQTKLEEDANREIAKVVNTFETEKNILELNRSKELQSRYETGRTSEEINHEYDKKEDEAREQFKNTVNSIIDDFTGNAQKEVVETIEKNIVEHEKQGIEETVRDHLRGFSRTIPSFLMAYGNETVTLENFDKIIPPEVFLEVTGITLSQFCFLRDGGTYIDEDTGEEKFFAGNLFDEIVFNDSIKEFLNRRYKLANYFEETSTEDIFDYIPPQATNQIFTPKVVVRKMVDLLEEENPGCFDNPDKTFIDLYMKSGLYITEIVKRLYQSENLKQLFPDKEERLRHIFEKQVFGLAPTEIIYKIAVNYILGFAKDIPVYKHNFKMYDAVPSAKAGTLEATLDTLYPQN